MSHTKNRNLIYSILILFFIGCQGEDGVIGPAGEDGTNGLNSLVNITNEASGTNCENGGIKVEVGIDGNSNGVLETDEVLSTTYVCNGVDGDISLSSVTTEPAGTSCENGGLKIDSGVDANGDGTLDDTEISTTAYVCNGIDGNNSLTKITNEPAGANCENGGLKIDSGVDTNSDGTLDDSEISATAYVCNGIDGSNTLTKVTNETSGTNCENGGIKIDSGVDTNSDGTLDDTEISATAYVCNGLDGKVSLVNITDENAGSNCGNGGVKIESGIDDDGDGTLDITEVEITRYICSGIDGGFDEQIRLRIELPGIPFFGDNFGYQTTSSTFDLTGSGLIDFNKEDFIGVDSILLASNPWGIDGINSYVELYNATDDLSIDNSEVVSNLSKDARIYIRSANIFDELPNTRIDLGIRVRSETEGIFVGSGQPYLILYRSN